MTLFCTLLLLFGLAAVSAFQPGALARTPYRHASTQHPNVRAADADFTDQAIWARDTLVKACTTHKVARGAVLNAVRVLETKAKTDIESITESHRIKRLLSGRWQVVYSSFSTYGQGYIPIEQVVGFDFPKGQVNVKTMLPFFAEGVRTARSILYDLDRRTLEVINSHNQWAEQLDNKVQAFWFSDPEGGAEGAEGDIVSNPVFQVIHVDDQVAAFRSSKGAISLLYRVEEQCQARDERFREQQREMYRQEIGIAELPSENPEVAQKMYEHLAFELAKYVAFFFISWGMAPFINAYTYLHAHPNVDAESALAVMQWNVLHGFDIYNTLP